MEPLGLICIAGGIFGVRRCSCVADRPHWFAASHTRLQTQADLLQSDSQQSSQQTHQFPPPPPPPHPSPLNARFYSWRRSGRSLSCSDFSQVCAQMSEAAAEMPGT